jgi:hypothetical protein
VRRERHVLGSQDLIERNRFGYKKGSLGVAMLALVRIKTCLSLGRLGRCSA